MRLELLLSKQLLSRLVPLFSKEWHCFSFLQVNTFQAVIGYDETDSYVIFLYPEDGLNFFGTRPKVSISYKMPSYCTCWYFCIAFLCSKESYNVEIELPARVGFSRGEVAYLLFSRTEGPHYSVTSDEQTVKNLYQWVIKFERWSPPLLSPGNICITLKRWCYVICTLC